MIKYETAAECIVLAHSSMQQASCLRELTGHTGSHSEVTFPPLPVPKLVLDLATRIGCKAKVTKNLQ